MTGIQLLKIHFEFENYLIHTPTKMLKYVIRFRTRNHRLPVETGCWNGTDLNMRKCQLCDSAVGDEYHYLLECQYFCSNRKRLLNGKYYNRHNIHSFNELMNIKTTNTIEYRKYVYL